MRSHLVFVLTLLFHDGFRRIELPERLDPLLLIDNAIATDIDDLKHVLHDAERRQGFVGHLANPVQQFAELSECDATNTTHIERTESILR
jgi:hypothetical protein